MILRGFGDDVNTNLFKLSDRKKSMATASPIPFRLGKCKTRAAYSAKPVNPIKLDLSAIRKKYEVLIDTPILLVIRVHSIETIVHGFGELIFKNSDDMDTMGIIAKEIYGCAIIVKNADNCR